MDRHRRRAHASDRRCHARDRERGRARSGSRLRTRGRRRQAHAESAARRQRRLRIENPRRRQRTPPGVAQEQWMTEFTEDHIPVVGIEDAIDELAELYGGRVRERRENAREVTLPLRRGVATAGAVECTISWAADEAG